ncbi:M15 family metallopeptidase [Peribacillus kribbensis]|uniref:M15 family metallopeptidase n=1 Tax=Peribacillus kribbensis TaxID=356658 RepID=UPI0003F85CFD|nr:M15 family metallopeptidase [Peribacillus kribbensis]
MNKKLAAFSLSSLLFLGGCQFGDDNKSGQKQHGQTENKKPKKAEDSLTLPASSFNTIKKEDGREVIQNPENLLVLVNKNVLLPAGYAPKDLRRPNVNFSFGDSNEEKALMRDAAATALENMFQAAEADGIELYAVSGYRSYDRQVALLNAEIEQVGKQQAEQAVAVPGTSEHQTGLSMDISSKSANLLLEQTFKEKPEGKWLADHAHLYGFIMRYPKGKEGITGYEYEPWHYRYVGKKTAKIIHDKGYTLEEFFKVVKKI